MVMNFDVLIMPILNRTQTVPVSPSNTVYMQLFAGIGAILSREMIGEINVRSFYGFEFCYVDKCPSWTEHELYQYPHRILDEKSYAT